MNYRSNLEAPDLRPYFKHLHGRVTPQSMGHFALSDFADKPADDPVFAVHKNCQFWTLDEAAILYNCARQFPNGIAADIGSHTGWTSSYLMEAIQGIVYAVDPMYTNDVFAKRATLNVGERNIAMQPTTADDFFSTMGLPLDVAVIDGNHDSPFPLKDAKGAAAHLDRRGLIMLHDFWGWPIQDAVTYLQKNGFKVMVYATPNGVACCWRGDFKPPIHIPDPSIDWKSVWQSRVTKFEIA